MAHLSGVLLIDCPASALNNFGSQSPMSREERRYDNWSATKFIKTRGGLYPYVSAQAFRYWLRETLKSVDGWTPAPIFREEKIAYTDANPIAYAEDDIFGYMRAPGASKEVKATPPDAKPTDQEKDGTKYVTLTRLSPLKVSTLISIASLQELGFDYGTMSRGDGDPVPHVHEFYRTSLIGLFSLDLRMAGRFYHVNRTGFRNLDSVRKKLAEDQGLTPYENGKAYELDLATRTARVRALLEGLASISGGAKQALHYTDISPKLLFLGVAKGGNHLFGNSIGAKSDGTPQIHLHALEEITRVFQDDLLSSVYAGLTQGYLDSQREGLKAFIDAHKDKQPPSFLGHPVEALRTLVSDLEKHAETWLA